MQLKSLGNKVRLQEKPDKKILETFPSPGRARIEFETDEFTSLCPVTGQPDWVNVKIAYFAYEKCVESKSLKLYLQSFRNEAGFMEQLSQRIFNDLSDVLKPTSLSVKLKCTPRGGLTLEAHTFKYRRNYEDKTST